MSADHERGYLAALQDVKAHHETLMESEENEDAIEVHKDMLLYVNGLIDRTRARLLAVASKPTIHEIPSA